MGNPPTHGAFRELLTHTAHLVFPLPDGFSDELGALLEPLAIAVHAMDLLKPPLGASFAIQGAGPIGLCALLAARLFAPSRVVMIEPLAYRRDLARSLGADACLAPEDPSLLNEVRRATGGFGADYVIEAVGELASFAQMADLARPGGKVAVIGIHPGDEFTMNSGVARRKGLTIYMVRRSRHTLERAIRITLGGYWRPEALITHRAGLSDLARELERVAHYRDGVLKAIIDPRK
jgi:L-iditol 2-dehydrogenase